MPFFFSNLDLNMFIFLDEGLRFIIISYIYIYSEGYSIVTHCLDAWFITTQFIAIDITLSRLMLTRHYHLSLVKRHSFTIQKSGVVGMRFYEKDHVIIVAPVRNEKKFCSLI